VNFNIQPIGVNEMAQFVRQHHYSAVMPRITKCAYGGFKDGDLKAAVSFGFGSRPLHTIKAIFPALGTQDYLEVGKLCLDDSELKNSESWFLSRVFSRLRKSNPSLKLVFSWSDGLWGKPGYVYQATNFLYGGFIWTDAYQMADGKRLHPLQIQSFLRTQGIRTIERTKRPTLETLDRIGWKHLKGKQFRYAYFLQDFDRQSPFTWGRNYPKTPDCEWLIRTANGWIPTNKPEFTGTWMWWIVFRCTAVIE
jgi:hypothetical protein